MRKGTQQLEGSRCIGLTTIQHTLATLREWNRFSKSENCGVIDSKLNAESASLIARTIQIAAAAGFFITSLTLSTRNQDLQNSLNDMAIYAISIQSFIVNLILLNNIGVPSNSAIALLHQPEIFKKWKET
jgi:hypothetical protein